MAPAPNATESISLLYGRLDGGKSETSNAAMLDIIRMTRPGTARLM